MKVAFLDVGQGDATVVLGPTGQTATVVDCARARVVLQCLREWQISVVDTVLLTHSDQDHTAGVVELLCNYGGYVQGLRFNIDSSAMKLGDRKRVLYEALLQECERRELSPEPAYACDKWEMDGVEFHILHPTHTDLTACFLSGKVNDASAVVHVTWNGWSVLLAGDAGEDAIARMMDRKVDLTARVLKFPHHGAYYIAANPRHSVEKLVASIDPDLVVISAGARNRYGHPHRKVLEAIASYSHARIALTNAGAVEIPKGLAGRLEVPAGGSVFVDMSGAGLVVLPVVQSRGRADDA